MPSKGCEIAAATPARRNAVDRPFHQTQGGLGPGNHQGQNELTHPPLIAERVGAYPSALRRPGWDVKFVTNDNEIVEEEYAK